MIIISDLETEPFPSSQVTPSFQEQFSNLVSYLLLLNQLMFHNKFSCLSWYSLVKSYAKKKSGECIFTGLLCNLFLKFERQFFYSHCYSKSTVTAGTPATERRLTKAVILLSSLAWIGIAAVFFFLLRATLMSLLRNRAASGADANLLAAQKREDAPQCPVISAHW